MFDHCSPCPAHFGPIVQYWRAATQRGDPAYKLWGDRQVWEDSFDRLANYLERLQDKENTDDREH